MPLRKPRVKKPPPYKGIVSRLPLDDFGRLDVRVGVITDCCMHPTSSTKHFICAVNYGEVFSKVLTAALVRSYEMEELIDKMVVVLCNVRPIWMKQEGSHESLLAARLPDTADSVELLAPPEGAEPGDIITVEGHPRDPDVPYMNPDLQIFENIFAHIKGCRLVKYNIKLEDLEDRMVVVLCNVEVAFSRGFDHTATLMAARKGDVIELLDPPPNSKIGDKVFVPGYSRATEDIIAPGDYRHPLRMYIDKKALSLFDDIAVDLKMNSLNQATYKDIPFQIEGKDGFITTKTLSDCSVIGVDCDTEMW